MLFLYLAVLITGLYWVAKILLPEMAKPDSSFNFFPSDVNSKRIGKLETLLAEKNKNITLLQAELKILHLHVSAFDKIKILMDEEIQRLREQNRIFRSELGLPTVQSKETSTT